MSCCELGLICTRSWRLLNGPLSAKRDTLALLVCLLAQVSHKIFVERAFLLGGIHLPEDEMRLKMRTNTAPEWKNRFPKAKNGIGGTVIL